MNFKKPLSNFISRCMQQKDSRIHKKQKNKKTKGKKQKMIVQYRHIVTHVIPTLIWKIYEDVVCYPKHSRYCDIYLCIYQSTYQADWHSLKIKITKIQLHIFFIKIHSLYVL